MLTLIITVHVIVSLFLIGVVLVQSGKGAGLTATFGMGGMGQSLFGVQAGTLLTRLTTALAIVFMITSLSLTMFMGHNRQSVVEKMMGKEGAVKKTLSVETKGKRPEKRQKEKSSANEGTQRLPQKSPRK